MATDARSKYLGKQYGQVKVPTVKVKAKETTKNFMEGWENSINKKSWIKRQFIKNHYKKVNNN